MTYIMQVAILQYKFTSSRSSNLSRSCFFFLPPFTLGPTPHTLPGSFNLCLAPFHWIIGTTAEKLTPNHASSRITIIRMMVM